jgi:hypothetical protein
MHSFLLNGLTLCGILAKPKGAQRVIDILKDTNSIFTKSCLCICLVNILVLQALTQVDADLNVPGQLTYAINSQVSGGVKL